MTPDRWTLALQSDELAWPEEGRVLVMCAQGDADLAPLGDVHAVTVNFPAHLRLHNRGFAVGVAPEGDYSAALVQIVKSKAASLSAIAEALAHVPPGGVVAVDGQKTEGIESLLKAVRAVLPVEGVLSKSHGKLFWLRRPRDLPEAVLGWIAEPQQVDGGYQTLPGMFSADGPDAGSELLIALLPQLKGRVADFGAGWGYLAGEVLAEQEAITAMDLVEADWAALQAAMVNVADDRAQYLWADVTTFTPDDRYDAVISNPPFHTGRAAEPALGQAFIAAAARALKPGGQFFMVANRHLPYEATLKEHFATGTLLAELGGYKLYQAGKPKPARRI